MKKAGLSFRAIAAQLGVDVRTAWEDYHAELAALRDLTEQAVRDHRTLELERLDSLFLSLAMKIRTGDPYAIDVARKISESRRKLLGLDAPTKIAPTDPSGDCSFTPGVDVDVKRLSSKTLAAIERDLQAAADADAIAAAEAAK